MVYWRLLEDRDTFADDEPEPELAAAAAGASCFENAVEMEWPVLLDRREAVRESMMDLFALRMFLQDILIYELIAFIGWRVDGSDLDTRSWMTMRQSFP